MSFAEKGAVADIEPAFFIGYLYRLKATGTLKFDDGAIQRAVYFRDGRVLFSSSNAPEDQLGAILVAGGKIGQEQFDAVVGSLGPKQSIAAALSQGGLVSQRDIGDAARKKVEQIIASCCAQTAGQYEFEDGALPKGALDLKLTTEKLLIAAFEALEPSGFLARVLKSPVAVLAPADFDPVDQDLIVLKAALDGLSTVGDLGVQIGMTRAAADARAGVLVVIGGASVLTSQIEEMALPEIAESLSLADPETPALSAPAPRDAAPHDDEPVEAETVMLAAKPRPSSGLDESLASEATVVMKPAKVPKPDPSTEATMVMGTAPSPIPAPASPGASGAIRVTGSPRRERATTQDLDAVKELIDSPAPARPGAASIPTQRWEPVLSADGRPPRSRGLAGVIQNPVVRGAVAVVAVLMIATIAWVGYQTSRTARPSVQAPTPAVPLPTATLAESPAALASPEAAPVAPALPTRSSAATRAQATPLPRAASTPTPSPKAAVAASATPAPVTPASRGTQGDPAAAYAALKAGKLTDAGVASEAIARSRANEFSIQILVACAPSTIEKALANDPSPDLFVLPASINGRACHRLMRGFFPSAAAANQAVGSLPPYYVAEGAKPRSLQLKTLLP